MRLPPNSPTRSRLKKIILVLGALLALLLIVCFLQRDLLTFALLQADSLRHAGTWEDDPGNWQRAFHEPLPATVKVIHSKYWRSNHFTYEYMYCFEVVATPEWREQFLKQHRLVPVTPPDSLQLPQPHQLRYDPRLVRPRPREPL